MIFSFPIPKRSSDTVESKLITYSGVYYCEEKLLLAVDLYSLMHWKSLFLRHSWHSDIHYHLPRPLCHQSCRVLAKLTPTEQLILLHTNWLLFQRFIHYLSTRTITETWLFRTTSKRLYRILKIWTLYN